MTVTSAMCSVPSSSSQNQSLLSNGGSPHRLSKTSTTALNSTAKRWTREDSPTNSLTGSKTVVNADSEPLVRAAWETDEPGGTNDSVDDSDKLEEQKVNGDDNEDQELMVSQSETQEQMVSQGEVNEPMVSQSEQQESDALTLIAQNDQLEEVTAVSSLECQCPRHNDDYLFVNLRGIRFAVCSAHLERRPTSRLATMSKLDKNFSVCEDEFYFDRNPTVFNSLLDFYSQGEMHLPSNICIQAFRRELEYWRLEPELLAPCCWSKYRKAEEEERTLARVQKEWGSFGARIYTDFDEHGNKVPTMQKIWLFLNEPQTSFGAKLWSVFMILMIGISIAVLSLETMVEMRQGPDWFWANLANITEKRLVYILEHSEPHEALVWVEFITLIVLTAEFFMRLVTCPSKKDFCKSVLNIADVIGIMPIWVMISLYFSETKIQGTEKGAIVFAYYFMMCMRLLRIFRLFKLVKHYKTLKILLLAVKASYRELLLLVILLTMGVIIYANLVYFVEVEHDNFMSIPEGFWWAIVTMTTVGYGDYYPKSGLGYVVGSFCAITGILVIALPVPVIANNFSTYYSSALAWERMNSKDTPLEYEDEVVEPHSESSGSGPHHKNNMEEII